MTENQYLDGTYAAARLEGWAQLANPYQFVGSQKSCLQISMNKDRFAWKATRRQSFNSAENEGASSAGHVFILQFAGRIWTGRTQNQHYKAFS